MAISKIKTNSIANDAITSDKLATGGIATVDMADGSVTSLKIAAGAVDTVDIADSAITTAKIAAGAVATVDIADAAVTTAKIASSVTITNLTGTNDASISGLTVGKGAGASDTNTVVGAASALAANTSGTYNNAFGRGALQQNTSGAYNSAFGWTALLNSTTGSYNTAIGNAALTSNTTASWNTAVGYQAGYANTSGVYSTFIGTGAGYTATTGGKNTFIGQYAGFFSTGTSNTFIGPRASTNYGAGELMTTGSSNTIVGGFSGNQDGLDIRTSDKNIVLSDGDGVPRFQIDNNGVAKFANATSNRGAARAQFQIVQGVLTSAASGVAKSFAYVGHHHCLRIYISVGGPNNACSGGTWMGRSLFTCGSGATTQEQTQVYYSGSETNLTGISVNYLNGGGTTPGYANYTLTITNTFTGTTPLIWYTIEGISELNIVPFQN